MPLTWVEISQKNLLGNLEQLSGRLNPQKTRVLAVIKGNAYGHGLLEVADAVASKVEWFGVDDIEEGLVLRQEGFKQRILILGYVSKKNLSLAIRSKISFVAYSPETIRAAAREAKRTGERAIVHLKIETGTNRQGVGAEEILALANLCRKLGVLVEGIYTHFADIEDTLDHSFAMNQLEKFKRAQVKLKRAGFNPLLCHTAPTAGTILFPQTHFNLVRLGIGLYGLWPSKETRIAANHSRQTALDLRPVLSWKTRLAQVKEVAKRESIGYGRTFVTARKSRVGVVPVGYYDGYDRKLSNIGRVLIRGKSAPVVGRVAMNMIAVDLTDIVGAKPEDEVVLIGRQGEEEISADELAEKIGTINYEVVSRINPLHPRISVK